MNLLTDWGTLETTITAISGGIVAIITAIAALIYKYKQAKKVDFKDVSRLIKEIKNISDYFESKKRK